MPAAICVRHYPPLSPPARPPSPRSPPPPSPRSPRSPRSPPVEVAARARTPGVRSRCSSAAPATPPYCGESSQTRRSIDRIDFTKFVYKNRSPSTPPSSPCCDRAEELSNATPPSRPPSPPSPLSLSEDCTKQPLISPMPDTESETSNL
ncbi:unnamed protein product [Danaus chrysippus]|uniref:(African queen) hypothetical protein n=1 Tax=Danaus chrysippus TaxID=151541 RepID=A0A8J2R2T7_9NEOP|nr:unnamed protein product [Danaus chrysippus]